jgi:hypothetical protein
LGGVGCSALRESRSKDVKRRGCKDEEGIYTEDAENTEFTEKSSERGPRMNSGAFCFGNTVTGKLKNENCYALHKWGAACCATTREGRSKKEGRPPWQAPLQRQQKGGTMYRAPTQSVARKGGRPRPAVTQTVAKKKGARRGGRPSVEDRSGYS